MKQKYATIDLIEDENKNSDKNIEIIKINALISIANELAEANELKCKELARTD